MVKKIILAAIGLIALVVIVMALQPRPAAAGEFYTGVEGVYQWNEDGTDVYGPALVAGYQVGTGVLDVGVEGKLIGLGEDVQDIDTIYGQIGGKVGVNVTDEVSVFSTVALGTDLGPKDDTHVIPGVGAEYRVSDNFSVRGEYEHGFAIGSTGQDFDRVSVGLFGRF